MTTKKHTGDWKAAAYEKYKWIVRDPDLLGGKLAVRGTRLSASFVLACLAEGMSAEEITQTYGPFPQEAIPEIMKVAAELLDSSMWLLDANMPVQLVALLSELGIEADSAVARGRNTLSNGSLVNAAVRAKFAVLLTRDRCSENPQRALLRPIVNSASCELRCDSFVLTRFYSRSDPHGMKRGSFPCPAG